MSKRTALHKAVEESSVETVISLLDQGTVDINGLNEYGLPPLYYAIKMGFKPIVETLLARGADVNTKDNTGDTPLHTAAHYGSKVIVDPLLARGADVNTKNDLGDTPLLIAVNAQYESVVEVLLARGADVNTKNIVGDTPLHYAVYELSDSIVEVLLARGADVNTKNDLGDTPLHYAADYGSELIVDALLARGADVNSKNEHNDTPLHNAAHNGSEFIVDAFLASGADVNEPLHDAVYGQYESIVELLLASGADVNVKNKNGHTPLQSTFRSYHLMVDAFLATVSGMNEQDYTPLHNAVYGKYESIVETLVASGADAKNIPIDTSFTKRVFIKLKCANFDIGTEKCVLDLNTSDHTFHVRCLEEVERLKLKQYCGCSLFDIFSNRSDPTFLPNEEMELATRSDILKTEFPLFANLLKVVFWRAKQRYKLLNSAQQIFEVLPEEMRRLILSFLDCTDHVNLVKACE